MDTRSIDLDDKTDAPGAVPSGGRTLRLKKNRYWNVRLQIVLSLLRRGKLPARKILNALYAHMALFLNLRTSARTPMLINFELWNECNESCVFCRSTEGDIPDTNPDGPGLPIAKGKMPIEIYEQIVDQAKDGLILSVPYINGEPLLSKDIYRAIQFASDRKVGTLIATNGVLLNERNSRKLLEAGLDFIKIHLSGFTQPVHSIEHRIGDVERIKENMVNLVRINREGGYGTLILMDYILYEHNKHELELCREFSQDLGILFNMRPGNPRGMENTELPQSDEPIPVNKPCDWLWTAMSVDWNGAMYPCCDHVTWSGADRYGTFSAGETDLRETWNGDRIRLWRETHATKGRSPIPICANCPRQGIAFKW